MVVLASARHQEVAVAVVCPHVQGLQPVTARTPEGCEECLAAGDRWVHLRLCLSCGHVGCCDSSPNRHATRHFHATNHPVIRSFEPGEAWRWCYVDDAIV
ncbi:ubiquitin carboxyl-terminal hydrolase 14 [Carbonactinospora thermoautotrophica]|uniref:ubiquitin carboxyl-terminal hydrolase 14 n=1 Tax=Carbonactinospora thermoautotrophica TaxID=1469144 RepID=UPI0008309ACB|nr:UBP-type zinc finger domain-containing protein [Carbonactinospora thermoautotrophica]